jgi:hypothetical protein
MCIDCDQKTDKIAKIQSRKGNEFIAVVRRSYLSKFVDPYKDYNVSYFIDNNGNKIKEPTTLIGADLTENQIQELFENERL